jgi:hypothetical protein
MVRLGLISCVLMLACSASVPPEAAMDPRKDRHVIALVQLGADGPKVLARRVVEGPPQIDRAPPEDGWEVEVSSKDGRVLHAFPIRPVGVTRGEFAGPDGQLRHVRWQQPAPVLTVRLPVLPQAAQVRVLGRQPRGVSGVDGKPVARTALATFAWSEVAP